MTGLDQRVAGLLTECDAIGIRLVPAGGGGLTIDAPQEVLTPDLVDQLRIHKAELLVRLQPHARLETRRPAPTAQTKPVCRCGSTTWLDVAIHDGRSNRRDCARCGRFIDFSRWYGSVALQADE
ncbi:MAG: hypothetical protein AB7O59_01580 [Pirellulales bacterium]